MKRRRKELQQTNRQRWLFAVRSRVGFVVRTTRGYWTLITAVKHPSVAGKELEVIRALTEPDEVRLSKRDASVYLFYRKVSSRRYLCVVTKRAEPTRGFIMTAYVTDRIKEGRLAWKR